MRRIYESEALERDKEEPFVPRDRGEDYEPQAFRSINSASWSDRLLPHAVRRRAVGIRLSVPKTEFERGEAIPFEVTMKNALPIPVSIRTDSPIRWTWRVDGHEEASHVPLREPPDRPSKLSFGRGERKRFRKRWSQKFRVSDTEWHNAEPGEHTLRAEINVDDPATAGLVAETTIRILP